MSDRLALANAIEDAGIERAKAERMASVIFDAIHDNVATKADIAPLATKTEVAAVSADVRAVRADVQLARIELNELKDKMALIEHRLVTRLGGLVIVVAGVLFAVLRYLPPAGHGG